MQKNNPQFKAFERALWSDYPIPSVRYDEMLSADPAAYMATLNHTWKERDWGKFALLAGAIDRNVVIPPKMIGRLGFVLAHTGRFEEALTLLRSRRADMEGDATYWLDVAQANAGTGRLDEAAEAYRRCLQLMASRPDIEEALAEVEVARDLAGRLHQLTEWADFRRLVDLYYEFGAVAAAARVVRYFLARRFRAPPESLEDVLRAVQMALSVLPPDQALPLMRDLRYGYNAGLERRLIRHTQDILAGRMDEAEAITADHICKRDRELRFVAALACLAGGKRRVAIARLGDMAKRYMHDWEVRLVLARATGEELLATTPITYRTDQTPKVFDLIMFNNERELLQVKLAEEDDWVDQFVIVEANRTFTGLEKPFYFEQWKSEFSRYAHKIVHVKVDTFPEWASTTWAREFHQRDMGAIGASGLWGVDDLVMLTDTDEIVDRPAVEGFDGDYAAFLMGTYRYYLNYRHMERNQYTGVAVRAKYLQRFGVSFARNMLRSYRLIQLLDNAGWHFTSVSDAAGVAAKMRSYSHQEYAHMDEAYFERLYDKISRKTFQGWERLPIDESFPTYVQQNQASLAHLIIPLELGGVEQPAPAP